MVAASYFFYGWWDWRFIFLLAASTTIAYVGGHRRPVEGRPPGGAVGHPDRAARAAGLVQVLRVLRGQLRQRLPYPRAGPPAAPAGRHPSGRHLLLHLHGHQLRGRHLPGHAQAGPRHRHRRLPLVLPPPGGRPDRPGHRAAAPDPPAAGRAPRRLRRGLLADRRRPGQEGGPLLLPRPPTWSTRCSPPPSSTRPSRSSSPSTAMRCRSTPTSAATPTSPSASPCCSGSGSPRTSTRPYTAVSLQDFWRRWHITLSSGCATTSTSRSAATGAANGGSLATSWSPCSSAASGTGRRGPSSGGAFHGIGQVVGRQRRRLRQPVGCPLEPAGLGRVALARFATFQLVCFGWLFFRASCLQRLVMLVGSSSGGEFAPW